MTSDSDPQSDEMLHEFRPKWSAWFWPLVLTLGLATPVVWYKRLKVRYTVTTERVQITRGLLTKETDELLVPEVKRIKTSQSLGERIIGGGTITVDSGVDELTLTAVPDHEDVAQSIRDTKQ